MNADLIRSVLAAAEKEMSSAKERGDMSLFFRFYDEVLNLKLQLIILEEI